MSFVKRIFLVGPTASGKSELAVHIAQQVNGEIISADARQCYKGMEIGSAAPESKWLDRVPHHNVSNLEPSTPDDASAFSERATRWIEEITSRDRLPLIVGGSTLYLQALIQPFDALPPANPDHIVSLQEQAENEGLESLYAELSRVDPDYTQKMDGMNRHRIIRALDVWRQTGKPFSSFHHASATMPASGDLWIGLQWHRAELVERIERRTHTLFGAVFKEEVQNLMDWPDLLRTTVGFKQMAQYLRGEITEEEALEFTIIATRQYAKRQMTWFRRWPFIEWFHPENERDELLKRVVNQVAVNPKNPYI